MAGLHSEWHYRLRNEASGTILDLSGADDRSVIGYHEKEDANNQHWRIEQDENGLWTFYNKEESDMILGFGYAQPNDGISCIGQQHECKWAILNVTDDTYQIVVPHHDDPQFVVDLSDHGNPDDGTPVTLWTNAVTPNQIWRFEPVPGP